MTSICYYITGCVLYAIVYNTASEWQSRDSARGQYSTEINCNMSFIEQVHSQLKNEPDGFRSPQATSGLYHVWFTIQLRGYSIPPPSWAETNPLDHVSQNVRICQLFAVGHLELPFFRTIFFPDVFDIASVNCTFHHKDSCLTLILSQLSN